MEKETVREKGLRQLREYYEEVVQEMKLWDEWRKQNGYTGQTKSS